MQEELLHPDMLVFGPVVRLGIQSGQHTSLRKKANTLHLEMSDLEGGTRRLRKACRRLDMGAVGSVPLDAFVDPSTSSATSHLTDATPRSTSI